MLLLHHQPAACYPDYTEEEDADTLLWLKLHFNDSGSGVFASWVGHAPCTSSKCICCSAQETLQCCLPGEKVLTLHSNFTYTVCATVAANESWLILHHLFHMQIGLMFTAQLKSE